jgi:hypothetical protein
MRFSVLFCSLAIALACDADAKSAEPTKDDPQLPPEGHAAIGPWIAAGHYKSWACEPEPHASRPPGAHGRTRICSNDALSNAAGEDAYPVGAAAVKELRRGADDAIGGYAIYRKVGASDKGVGWYWYEVIGTSVVADGRGDKGDAKDVCASCHEAAPRDFVYTHVKR